jgi:hypothetical protein
LNSDNQSCEACHSFFSKLKRQTPCGPCEKPYLDPSNYSAWELFQELTSQARSGGMAGILGFDLNVLPVMFRFHGIPEEEWFCYYYKLARTWAVASKIWNKPKEKKS